MIQAYGALINGGTLMKPYIVEEVRHADGRVEKRAPTAVRRVISGRTSVLLTGMLTSVIKNGQTKAAQVPGYYVGGKTGTAQVAGPGGAYLENVTNHSFVGFAPADEPKFVMLVKFDRPTAAVYADATTAPVFSELASFLLNYYDIPPDY
jgi:cell division protein FtsI/penicillin-binding protein 2